LAAHQPLAPIRHRRFGAEALGHLGRVRLGFVAAILAYTWRHGFRCSISVSIERPVTLCKAHSRSKRGRPLTTSQ
jgi:hypothetical protein